MRIFLIFTFQELGMVEIVEEESGYYLEEEKFGSIGKDDPHIQRSWVNSIRVRYGYRSFG